MSFSLSIIIGIPLELTSDIIIIITIASPHRAAIAISDKPPSYPINIAARQGIRSRVVVRQNVSIYEIIILRVRKLNWKNHSPIHSQTKQPPEPLSLAAIDKDLRLTRTFLVD